MACLAGKEFAYSVKLAQLVKNGKNEEEEEEAEGINIVKVKRLIEIHDEAIAQKRRKEEREIYLRVEEQQALDILKWYKLL